MFSSKYIKRDCRGSRIKFRFLVIGENRSARENRSSPRKPEYPGEKRNTQGKISQRVVENQQTQPTYHKIPKVSSSKYKPPQNPPLNRPSKYKPPWALCPKIQSKKKKQKRYGNT